MKLVVPSRTQVVAGQIRAATRRGLPVVFAGADHGRRPSTKAMLDHLAAGLAFAATETAALSFDDNLDKVTARGVRLIADDEARRSCAPAPPRCGRRRRPGRAPASARRPRRADALLGGLPRRPGPRLQPERLQPRHSVRDLGARPGRPHAARGALLCGRRGAARAHAPAGGGRRRFAALPQVTAADTGPAALLGALGDELTDAVLVNVGNGHTICAVALEGRLAGIYEDHTNRLDAASLESNVRRFLAGDAARRRGAAGRRARGRPRRPRARRPARPGHRPLPRAARRQLAGGALPGALRRHDDDRSGRA